MMQSPDQTKANKTHAGNSSDGIRRVINVSRSSSQDPLRFTPGYRLSCLRNA